ncbi:MAG: hypothetical protein LCH35_09830 [Bacteroidetes bacterium]|uniref:hypothetical protein n=1 Tax=Flavobacterium sp. TaxID=239 RepID=UPI002FDB4FFE|nr:hypothetical protein [Bacteroidota bacterium]
MGTKSIASLKREQKRNSQETIEFKNKVIEFLKNAKPEIEYAIKRDLAIMTSMPFYKDRPKVVRFKMKPIDLICEYAELFTTCSDKDFIADLIKKLSINQNQTIRKAAPRIGKKSDIWEHVIPAKIIASELTVMVINNDLSDLRKMLEIYERAGQRGLTKEQNKLLDKYRCSMPSGWDWRLSDINPLARHTEVGIYHEDLKINITN